MANMIRWNDPFSGLSSLHSQIDEMFNEFFGSSRMAPAHTSAPAMDIYNEGDKQLVVELHVPGFDQKDIEVNVHNNVLDIKAEKQEREENKDKKRTYMIRESSASFYRRVALPKHADADKVAAEFENGMLKVTVPYKELPEPKRIQVSSSAKSEKKK